MKSVREIAKRVLPERAVSLIREIRRSTVRPASGPSAAPIGFGRSEPTRDIMIALESRLWSTRNPHYADRLARLVRSASNGSEAHVRGVLALARWYLYLDKSDAAWRYVETVHTSDPILEVELDLMRADCLCHQREGQRALSILSKLARRNKTDPNLILRIGYAVSLLNTPDGPGSSGMSDALNTVYGNDGFGLIRRTLTSFPIGMANISCDVADAEPKESLPRVSVITRVREPFSDSHVGISSLVNQSWRQLELLILANADGRDYLVAAAPALFEDKRVVLLDESRENEDWLTLALRRATGELATTHCARSWAHPQRVEAQASAMLADPTLQGTISSHVCVDSNLALHLTGHTSRRGLVSPDPHSTMLRVGPGSPDELAVRFRSVHSHNSSTSGRFRPPDGFAPVNRVVPLTLSRAEPAAHSTADETATR